MKDALSRFFGGPPIWVLVRLVILSLVVGIVFSALGLAPADIYHAIKRFVQHIYDLGFGAIEAVWQYFVIGAAIVFPIWLILRVLKVIGPKDKRFKP